MMPMVAGVVTRATRTSVSPLTVPNVGTLAGCR